MVRERRDASARYAVDSETPAVRATFEKRAEGRRFTGGV